MRLGKKLSLMLVVALALPAFGRGGAVIKNVETLNGLKTAERAEVLTLVLRNARAANAQEIVVKRLQELGMSRQAATAAWTGNAAARVAGLSSIQGFAKARLEANQTLNVAEIEKFLKGEAITDKTPVTQLVYAMLATPGTQINSQSMTTMLAAVEKHNSTQAALPKPKPVEKISKSQALAVEEGSRVLDLRTVPANVLLSAADRAKLGEAKTKDALDAIYKRSDQFRDNHRQWRADVEDFSVDADTSEAILVRKGRVDKAVQRRGCPISARRYNDIPEKCRPTVVAATVSMMDTVIKPLQSDAKTDTLAHKGIPGWGHPNPDLVVNGLKTLGTKSLYTGGESWKSKPEAQCCLNTGKGCKG